MSGKKYLRDVQRDPQPPKKYSIFETMRKNDPGMVILGKAGHFILVSDQYGLPATCYLFFEDNHVPGLSRDEAQNLVSLLQRWIDATDAGQQK